MYILNANSGLKDKMKSVRSLVRHYIAPKGVEAITPMLLTVLQPDL